MRGTMAFIGVCLLLTAIGLGWWSPIERREPVQERIAVETPPPIPEPVVHEAVAEEAEPGPQEDGERLYTTANVRLRSGPSSNFNIVWTAPVGTKVRSMQVDGNWHFVATEGHEGWMFSRYLADSPPG